MRQSSRVRVWTVADHAKRATSAYPLCQGRYYGVPQHEVPAHFVPPHLWAHSKPGTRNPERPRGAPNDLSFYANIPVPTSYMALGSRQDFLGVYTDNQPDFSFLQPGETKSWSQYWYPIQKIGPPPAREPRGRNPSRPRSAERAARDQRDPGVQARDHPVASRPRRLAMAAQTVVSRAAIRPCMSAASAEVRRRGHRPAPEAHFQRAMQRLTRRNPNPRDGEPYYNLGLCLRYQADALIKSEIAGCAFRSDCGSRAADWLDAAYDAFYKATWNQAWTGPAYHALAEIDCVRRDWARACEHAQRAGQASASNRRAMNLWALALKHRGDARAGETMLQALRRTDPLDWWTRHLLGETLTCDLQTRLDIAHDYARAGCFSEAIALLRAAASSEAGGWAGLFPRERAEVRGNKPREVAIGLNHPAGSLPTPSWGAAPLVQYTLGWLHEKRGHAPAARKHYRAAAALPPDYCFPARLEEQVILEAAMRANPKDARAPYYLGNWLYDRRRHDEAIRMWERSAKLDPNFSIVWRNLGLGYFNIRRQPARARAAYERAFACAPHDARLFYERDQLWKRTGVAPTQRLRELEQHRDLVRLRDDLSVELCALYNQVGQHEQALALLGSRHFQPWEGGEGSALGQHVRAHLALGRAALQAARRGLLGRTRRPQAVLRPQRNAAEPTSESLLRAAATSFQKALEAPHNLGEAKHLLANQSHVHYWLGCAGAALGDRETACRRWRTAGVRASLLLT